MVWYIMSITITITKVREINKEKNRLFMIVQSILSITITKVRESK